MALAVKGKEVVEAGVWYGAAVVVAVALAGGLAFAVRGTARGLAHLVRRRRSRGGAR